MQFLQAKLPPRMNCPKAQNRCQAEECDFFGVTPAFAGGIESTSACRSGFIARAAGFVSAVSHREKQVISKLPPILISKFL